MSYYNNISKYGRNSISVSETSLSAKPTKRVSYIDGSYRFFENHYVNGIQYTFGFPQSHCTDKRVWVGIDKQELERISIAEARRRIRGGITIEYTNSYRQISTGYGFCSNCSKKLRGNRSKKHCFECWTNGCR